MLEALHRDGRARVLAWTHGERTLRTPNLLIPKTAAAPFPSWTEAALVADAADAPQGAFPVVSGGTWFFPAGTADGEAPFIAPLQPAPTTEVQVTTTADLAVWHDAGGWASRPRQALEALIEARTQATPGRALYAPALGEPASYAVWTYLGVDMFDASPLLLAAARGVALTTDGAVGADAAAEVDGRGADPDLAATAAANLDAARAELVRVRQAIEAGTLRALVERRVAAHPDLVALLRWADREHAYLEAAAPVHGSAPIACNTDAALRNPEVVRFRRRIRAAYRPPEGADILVLLPCSAKKPYRTSKSHRYFQRALDDSGVRHRCHEVMITSPLGAVPRELEEVSPAHRYDVPVTGEWSADEVQVIRDQVGTIMAAGRYRHVVVLTPPGTAEALGSILPPDATVIADRRPAGIEACGRLREALHALAEPERPGRRDAYSQRKLADIRAICSFQFHAVAADALTMDATARGRWPYVKLFGPEGQRATTTAGRAFLSLTPAGARIVAAAGTKRVAQGDFTIKKTGSLFAVGVESCDADIRPGDEVVVMRGGEMTACGVAMMAADEMLAMQRGVAVQLRHVVKTEQTTRQAEVITSQA